MKRPMMAMALLAMASLSVGCQSKMGTCPGGNCGMSAGGCAGGACQASPPIDAYGANTNYEPNEGRGGHLGGAPWPPPTGPAVADRIGTRSGDGPGESHVWLSILHDPRPSRFPQPESTEHWSLRGRACGPAGATTFVANAVPCGHAFAAVRVAESTRPPRAVTRANVLACKSFGMPEGPQMPSRCPQSKGQSRSRPTASVIFWPPKPKLLFKATSQRASRAWLGT